MSAWKEERIRLATGAIINHRQGWTYGGLGLVRDGALSILTWWTVIHLNTGHSIARVQGGIFEEMQDMVAEIADAGDWSFDGLEGFKNMFPNAPERVREIVLRRRPRLQQKSAAGLTPNPVVARAIRALREDEELTNERISSNAPDS